VGQDASQRDAASGAAARPKLSWSEKRERRRKGRRRFEELVGWIIVPALIYVGYLIYQAVGGIPPEVSALVSDLVKAATGAF
jgi:hypothetical protein